MKIFPVIHRIAALLLICLIWTSCKKDNNLDSTLPASTSGISNISDTTSLNLQNISTTPSQSKPLTLSGQSNKVINMLDIQGGGTACLELDNCNNITIQNCVLHNSTKDAIILNNCKNIKVANCYMYQVSAGVNATASTGINVSNNQFLNMLGPFPSGQFVQFDNVYGGGNRVIGNIGENVLGQSNPEDGISMYESNGTADDPIQINNNQIRGGGPSKTGSGIELGDDGGSYQVAQNNTMVNPGSAGIEISSGHNNSIINNTIYSIKQNVGNVGIDIWNEYSSSCAINTITGNRVKWINAAGKENDFWNGNNCGSVTGLEDNTWNASIDESILPNVLVTALASKN